MYVFSFRTDPKEYALKQIEGAGLSMSACREIAVSKKKIYVLTHCSWQMFFFLNSKSTYFRPECCFPDMRSRYINYLRQVECCQSMKVITFKCSM